LNDKSQSGEALQLAFHDQETQFASGFALIRQAIDQHAFPGAALAVAYRGALIASQGFGHFTYDVDSPTVKADTVFDLASVTKVVATTTMAILLYERGLLDLDSPVSAILPEFISLSPGSQQPDRRAVTIRMLLAHSSGLPAYVKLFEAARTRDELIRAVLTTPLVATPGAKAEYSDIGFMLQGEILARVAGHSLALLAQTEIFMPLGMSRTCFNPPSDWKAAIPPTEDDRTFRHRVTQGEVNDENAWVMGGVAGHAGLFAPATDISRFAECILRGGSPILQSSTVKIFTRRQISPAGTSRALGWDTPSYPSSSGTHFSPRSFGHLGYTGTSLWIDPDRQLSVTFLTNRTWPDRGSQTIKQIRPLVHDAIIEAL
jgi:CubicO group peptidase (beta-lactamase class C family)